LWSAGALSLGNTGAKLSPVHRPAGGIVQRQGFNGVRVAGVGGEHRGRRGSLKRVHFLMQVSCRGGLTGLTVLPSYRPTVRVGSDQMF